jgi:Xaa-Pro aminopeptidase
VTRSRFAKLEGKLRENHIDHALFFSNASLRYLAGYTAGIETGPSPYSPVMGALFLERGAKPHFYLAGGEPSTEVYEEVATERFPGYTFEKPLEALRELSDRLVARLKKLPPSRVGVESEACPVAILDELRGECLQLRFTEVAPLVAEIRMIKDEEEIQTLRECCALCDAGQELARTLAQPGITELELFGEVRKAMEMKEGGRLPLPVDLVSGPRTAEIGGPPSLRRIAPGDPIIVDLTPRHHGYWGDSCNTCFAGAPSAEQRRFFVSTEDALSEAIAQVRPGVRACDLDTMVRKRMRQLGGEYPHQTGHGIGVTRHEDPRIVPYNTLQLKAGMVIALEPGAYFKDRWGMRLESVVRVTDHGAELLSQFRHDLCMTRAAVVSR